MRKLDEKVSNAVHVKRHTRGTSNEISFSVLDAAKNSQDEPSGSRKTPDHPILGAISMFTLGRWKKPISTPRREHGLTLSTGEFVSAENPGGRVSRESSLEQGGVQLDSSPASSSLKTTPSNDAVEAVPRRKESRAATRSSDSPWALPEDEVSRRKATRRRAKRVAVSACAVAAVAACAIGVTAIAKSYQAEQDGRARLAEAISSVEESYESIRMLEETVSTASAPLSQLDSETLNASVEEIDDALTATRSRLESDRTRLEGMYDALENNGDREACNEAIAVANASVNMIDAGRKILSETAQASNAHALSEGGWQAMLDGDASARDAAKLVEETSVESVEESARLSEAAMGKFNESQQSLNATEAAYDVDLTPFKEYLNVRIEAQQRALESDRAYLDRNKEAASSANDAYNQLDAQAAEMAKAFAGDPTQAVEAAFEERVKQLRSSFSADWARVEGGHVVICEYLGRISK